MKRTALKRSAPLKRGKPLRARKALARGVNIRRRNDKRAKARFARNFGGEAAAVRAMPCLCAAVVAESEWPSEAEMAVLMRRQSGLVSIPLLYCHGPVVDAHVVSRGAGGGRFDAVPLCQAHHDEQHACGIKTFAERYGLDLRLEADCIALEHPEPLGLKSVAKRWELEKIAAAHFQGQATLVNLDTYERDALLGWVRRRMAAYVAGAASTDMTLEFPRDREPMADWISIDLFDVEDQTALALCEAAGWPDTAAEVQRV